MRRESKQKMKRGWITGGGACGWKGKENLVKQVWVIEQWREGDDFITYKRLIRNRMSIIVNELVFFQMVILISIYQPMGNVLFHLGQQGQIWFLRGYFWVLQQIGFSSHEQHLYECLSEQGRQYTVLRILNRGAIQIRQIDIK